MIKENTPYRVQPMYQINWRYYIVKINDEYFVLDYINPRNILSVLLLGGKMHYRMYRIGENLNSCLLEYHEMNWLVRNYYKLEKLSTKVITSGIIISYFGVRSDGLREWIPLIFEVEGLIFLIWWFSLILTSGNKKEELSEFEEYISGSPVLEEGKLKALGKVVLVYSFIYLSVLICNGWFIFFPNWLTLLMIQIPYMCFSLTSSYAFINDMFVLSRNPRKVSLRKLN